MEKMNEEKFTQANYIITLYSEVHQLNVNYCNLINTFLEIDYKNKGVKVQSYSEEDSEKIKNLYVNIRFYSMQIYLKLLALKTQFKIIDENVLKLQDFYNLTKQSYEIKSDETEKFLMIINDILTNNLMQNLLSSSQELMNKIYGA